MEVRCPSCGAANVFEQPYPFHAGVGDQGFLYNDAGNCTLVWSLYDGVYDALLARHLPADPWGLSPAAQREFEAMLPPSPHGDRWRFGNPPRCGGCRAALSAPMGADSITYLVYPGSVVLELGANKRSLQTYVRSTANI
mgnify:CR=1 FL=1